LPLREKIIKFFSPKGGIWFLSPGLTSSGEEQVVTDLETYARRVSQTIEQISDIARAYELAERSILDSAIGRIYRGWEETEKIRWEIYDRVAQGRLFFPDSRGDMFALINKMSLIQLTMKDPRIFLPPGKPLREDLRYPIERLGETCKVLAQVLSLSIEYLNEDPGKALQEIRRATEYEKEIFRWIEDAKKLLSEARTDAEDVRALMLIEYIVIVTQKILECIYRVQEIAIKYV
jgi:uncharacterized protein Yka (UPF0111/DUF47 family)